MSDQIPKRSLIVGRHRTSVSLESEFWDRFKSAAAAQHKSINDLATEIDATKGARNLSSAIRLYVLKASEQRTEAA